MKIIEASDIGKKVLEEKGILILGLSINNRYFSEENIEKLMNWAAPASSTCIMIPDEPAVCTMMALGKSREDAERVARLKSNALENKCKKIQERLNLSSVTILRWKDIKTNISYQHASSHIQKVYNVDASFAAAIDETTREVLKNANSAEPSEQQISIGIQFLLQELAFITYADCFFSGRDVAYVYHRTMKILKDIVDGKYTFRAGRQIGFITAE